MFSKHALVAIAVAVLVPVLAGAQQVNEWLTVGSGGFSGIRMTKNLDYGGGGYYAACEQGNDFTSIMLSDDMGRTWETVRRDTAFDIYNRWPFFVQYIQSVARVGRDLVLAVQVQERTSNPYDTRLLRSSDRGENWQEIEFDTSDSPAYRNVISMYDEKTGVIIGAGMFYTDDGGLTWKKKPGPNESVGFVYHVQWFGPQTLMVVSGEHIHLTTDAGSNWQSTPSNAPAGRSNGYFFNTPDHGFAAGRIATGVGQTKYDAIYETTNGGESWKEILKKTHDPPFGLNSISFADLQNGIAVGQWGKILRTTDGGTTWNVDPPPFELHDPTIPLVVYPEPGHAVALTMNSIIHYTGRKVLKAPDVSVNHIAFPLNYTVSWPPVNGANSYRVQIASEPPSVYYNTIIFEDSVIFDSGMMDETQIDVSPLMDFNTAYYVRVKAFGSTNESAWCRAEKWTTVEEAESYTVPILRYPKNDADNVPPPVALGWSRVDDAVGYDLEIRETDPASQPVLMETGMTDTVYTAYALTPGKTHYWRVRARFHNGPGEWTPLHWFTPQEVTGVKTVPSADIELAIYPQPARGQCFVRLSGDGIPSHAVLYNVLGIRVREFEIKASENAPAGMLNLSGVAPGMYMLQVFARGMVVSTPLLVGG